MLANLLTLLLSLGVPRQVAGLECIQCTSDPSAPNSNCIGNENGTIASEEAAVCGGWASVEVWLFWSDFHYQDLTLPCDPKYGDEFCYTMITVEPANRTAANTGKVIFLLRYWAGGRSASLDLSWIRDGTEAAVTGTPTVQSVPATSRTTWTAPPGGRSGGKGAKRTAVMLTLLGAPVKEMEGRGEASVTVRHWRTAGQRSSTHNHCHNVTIIVTVLIILTQHNRSSLFRLVVQRKSSAERIVFFSNILVFIFVKFLIQ